MNSSISTSTSPGGAPARLKRVLSLPALVFFGLAYMIPLTVFSNFGYVSDMSEGHMPAAYVVTLVAMLVTASSFGAMVRAFPSSGSTYTYVRRSFGANTSFLVGWTFMLDYLLLPMIAYLFLGFYLQAYFPDVPLAVWILSSIAVVTTLNILGIKVVAKMNFILVTTQFVFIAAFIAAAVRALGDQEIPSPLSPFMSPDMPLEGVMGGAALLCLTFLGFDAVSTLTEETDNPRVKIPRAIFLCILICGVIYIFISYLATLVYPSTSFENLDTAALEVMSFVGGDWLAALFTAVFCAALFACAMAAQASVSRILYAMGRDAALPKRIFGQVNIRFRTPVNATLIAGSFGLIALVIDGATAVTLVNFGALTAFTFVNLSVIKHYVIDKGLRGPRAILRYAILPGTGVALTIWLWTSLSGSAIWLGIAWAGLGLVWLMFLTGMFRRKLPPVTFEEAADPEIASRDGQQAAMPTA